MTGASQAADAVMPVHRFSLHGTELGSWIVTGDRLQDGCEFADLAAAIAFARADCAAGTAMLELRIGGLYVVVHQVPGWPNRICARPPG